MKKEKSRRDSRTGAVLNIDKAGYLAYKKKRAKEQHDEMRIDALEKQAEDMKSTLDRIEKLLIGLTDGK